jgi:hypothetical protein
MWTGANLPLAIFAACMAICAPAQAGDWLVNSHIGETFEANDNIQQVPKSPGDAFGSITNFSFDALNNTPTLAVGFGTDLAFREYGGDGAQSSLDGFQGDARASLEKKTKLTDYHLNGSWALVPAAVSELTDSGILAANTTTTSYLANGGLQHQLNDLNALGWSATGTSVNFSNEDAGLIPYNDVVMTESWIRNLSPITNFTASLSTQWYQADNEFNTRSLIQSLTGQIDTLLTNRLKLMARAGGGVIRTDEDFFAGSTKADISDTSGNFVGGVDLAYELKNTTITATASHDFAPSSLGEVQDRTEVGLGIDHRINERTGLLLSGQFYDQAPSTSAPAQSNDREAMILSLTFTRELIRDWDLLVRYQFVQQDLNTDQFVPFSFDDGSSTSNAVFVTLNRNLHLLQ